MGGTDQVSRSRARSFFSGEALRRINLTVEEKIRSEYENWLLPEGDEDTQGGTDDDDNKTCTTEQNSVLPGHRIWLSDSVGLSFVCAGELTARAPVASKRGRNRTRRPPISFSRTRTDSPKLSSPFKVAMGVVDKKSRSHAPVRLLAGLPEEALARSATRRF